MDARTTALAAAAFLAVAGFATAPRAPAPTPEAEARLATAFPEPVPVSSADLRCLALNVYWEARGESELGREAVAHVTLNRVGSPGFPDTVCAVVRQGGARGPCQFHWVCDDRSDAPTESEAWLDAQMVAHRVLTGGGSDPTGGALYFHHVSLAPSWAGARHGTTRIGRHLFFKLDDRQLAQAE